MAQQSQSPTALQVEVTPDSFMITPGEDNRKVSDLPKLKVTNHSDAPSDLHVDFFYKGQQNYDAASWFEKIDFDTLIWPTSIL